MDKKSQDAVGKKYFWNDAGELSQRQREDEGMDKALTNILNIEFEWPSDLHPEVPPVECPSPVTAALIHKVLSKMKSGKAASASSIIAKMLKAAGEEGVKAAKELVEAVFINGSSPKDWEESIIISLYKGIKDEAHNRGHYRGLKHTHQTMKVTERVMNTLIDINAMQFSFPPGRGTTDAIFIRCPVQGEASPLGSCSTLPL